MDLAELATTSQAGDYLRQVRRAAGLSQEELASRTKTDMTPGRVSEIENGRVQTGVSQYLKMVAICDPTARLSTRVEGDDNGQ